MSGVCELDATVRRHTCDGCGRTEAWGPGWEWYGSFADLDGGPLLPRNGRRYRTRPIVKTCSQVCRDRLGTPPDPARQPWNVRHIGGEQ